MLKKTTRLVSVISLFFFAVVPVFGFGGSMSATEAVTPVVTEQMKKLTILIRSEGSKEILQVPLFSGKYAQLPVAMVNEEAITLTEFTAELVKMHSAVEDTESPTSQSYTKMLERLIAIKLINQEALNIGFDRTPAVQVQVEQFALKTLVQQLLTEQIKNLQLDEDVVEKLYRQMALEAKMLTYRFHEKTDAEGLLQDLQKDGDFKALAEKMVAGSKAEGGEDVEYIKLTELFPSVAKAVFDMEIGTISEVFQAEKGFLVFKLEDRRVYEDEQIRFAARQRVLQQQSRKKQLDYINELIEKYATFDDEAMAVLDFAKIVTEDSDAIGTEVFARLDNDQRPLVTITDGEVTVTITVAEVAGDLKAAIYHGIDKRIDAQQMDSQKMTIIQNKLTAITGKMEAEQQKLHTTSSYLNAVASYKERLLFDTFMSKAVLPGLTVPEEDVKKYYYNHLEDYSSPLMLKMKSLVFTDRGNAQEALKKLQEGSDFKWVSANMIGLADADNKDLLSLGGNLLSVNALPHDLQHKVTGAKQGAVFFYAGPGNLYYTLVVEVAFPPKAKTYQEVRQEVGRIIYAQTINEALADWVTKLKEVYKTEVFIVQDKI